jgi:hypothetical protein
LTVHLGSNLTDALTRNVGKEFDAHMHIDLTAQSRLLLSSAVFLPGAIYPNRDAAFKLEAGIAVAF